MSDESEQKEEKEDDEELPSTGTDRDLNSTPKGEDFMSGESYERSSHEYWVYDSRVDVTGPRPSSHVARVRPSKKKKRKIRRKKVTPRRKKVSTTKKRRKISKR
jgi:hypothetical protein